MSQFSTRVPIAKLSGKQLFSAGKPFQVSENEQYTYIFVHRDLMTLSKPVGFISDLFEKWFERGPYSGKVAEENHLVTTWNKFEDRKSGSPKDRKTFRYIVDILSMFNDFRTFRLFCSQRLYRICDSCSHRLERDGRKRYQQRH
jgi:hypothetical protein